eukprot:3452367-Pleurochrysis_carterae.AAC.1
MARAVLEGWKEGALVSTTELREGDGPFTAGRTEDSTILLEHPSCSRKHALFELSTVNGLSIQDLGSAHGAPCR